MIEPARHPESGQVPGCRPGIRLTSAQIEEFREQGYLVYGPLLEGADVIALGERIDALAAGEGAGGKEVGVRMEPEADALVDVVRRDRVWQLLNVAKADEVIGKFARWSVLVDMVRQLLRTEAVHFLQDQVLMKPAHHGSEVSWHQDSGYWTSVEPWVDPPAIATCWVAVDDVTEDNGCVLMVPGSHKHGLLEHRPGRNGLLDVQGVEFDAAKPVVLARGGVSFHHSCTVHGSGPNRTSHRRRGLALTYVRQDALRRG